MTDADAQFQISNGCKENLLRATKCMWRAKVKRLLAREKEPFRANQFHAGFNEAVASNDINMVQIYLDAGAAVCINAFHDSGCVMRTAIARRAWLVLPLLIKAGADINARSHERSKYPAWLSLLPNPLLDREVTPADIATAARLGLDLDASSNIYSSFVHALVGRGANDHLIVAAVEAGAKPIDVVLPSDCGQNAAVALVLCGSQSRLEVPWEITDPPVVMDCVLALSLDNAKYRLPFSTELRKQATDYVAQRRFALIKHRALEICIALQALELPALITLRIIQHSWRVLSRLVPMHLKWKLITHVKHFHD